MKFDTIENLQSLIDNEIEESTVLEYKRSFRFDKENKENQKWRMELAKDVSAMANAIGGTIIYGIDENEISKDHKVASGLVPISYAEMSKERLSQLLSSNIQPIIDNIEIKIIPNDTNSGFFIVQIPQSNTAHQNRIDHRYYKRRNATVESMEDYEIRDVMNRTKHPVIGLEFELHKTILNVTDKPLKILSYGKDEEIHSTEIKYELKYRLVNNGRVYAKYINYFINIPLELITDEEKSIRNIGPDDDFYQVYGDNTTRDLLSVKGLNHEYGPSRYDPLLPGVKAGWHKVELNCCDYDDINSLPTIECSVQADNAPERIIKVDWGNISVVEDTKDIIRDHNNIGFNPMLYSR